MEDFQTWAKQYWLDSDSDPIRGVDFCRNLEKELCFESDKSMWSNQQLVFKDHVKNIQKNTVKAFMLGIIQDAKRVRQMHDLTKLQPPYLKKGYTFNKTDWSVCDKEFSEDEIFISTKDGIHMLTRDGMDDKYQVYHQFSHK